MRNWLCSNWFSCQIFYQHAQYERLNALHNLVGRIGPVLAFMLADRRGQGSNPVGAEVINGAEGGKGGAGEGGGIAEKGGGFVGVGDFVKGGGEN